MVTETFMIKYKGKGLILKGMERFRVKDKRKGLEYRVKKSLIISSAKAEYPEVHFTSKYGYFFQNVQSKFLCKYLKNK